MKLKLSEIASIAEVVGAIAVVVSLVYVGVQVRDTTRAVRSAAINDANIAVQSWYMMMSSEPEMAEVWLDGILSPEPLSRDEEFRFMMTIQAIMYAFQNVFLLSQEGSLDTDVMSSLATGMQTTRHTPGFQRFWAQRRSFFYPEFAAYVDEIQSVTDAPTDTVEVYRLPPGGQD